MIGKATSCGVVTPVLALLLAASIVITGCNTPTPGSVLERNKRIVRHMNDEVWNKGNLDAIDKLFAPDFVRHFLPDGSESRGIDSLREHVRKHREAFPDWREEIRRIVAEGDLVVIHFVSTGTNEGDWLGNPPTGRRIQINEVSILRIEEDRIAEQWLLPDMFGMQQQLARPQAAALLVSAPAVTSTTASGIICRTGRQPTRDLSNLQRESKELVMEKTFDERVAEAKAEVPAISAQVAKERKDKDPATLFIDPRNEADIRSSTGIIPGALSIQLEELTEKPDAELPRELQSRTRPIITACKGGPMGALAAHALKKRGFTDVAFIDGGTQSWLDAGYTTDK